MRSSPSSTLWAPARPSARWCESSATCLRCATGSTVTAHRHSSNSALRPSGRRRSASRLEEVTPIDCAADRLLFVD
eukprot:6441610-Prymnesium_polylepis.1